MKKNTLYLLITSVLIANLSCKEHVFENPVDPEKSLALPTDVTISTINDTSASFRWTNPNIDKQYPLSTLPIDIQVSMDGVNYSSCVVKSSNDTSALISRSFVPDSSVSFRLRFKTSAAASQYSAIIQVKPSLRASNLKVFYMSDVYADLQWTDNSTFETDFYIERSTDGVNFALADSVGANVTVKSVAGVYLMGTTYSFRVRAKSAHSYSGYSNVATTTLEFNAPSNLTIVNMADFAASLFWKDNSTFDTGLLIERSADGTNFTLVDSASAQATERLVDGVYLLGTAYSFRVRAKSTFSYSGYSNVVTATLVFGAPSNLSVTSITETSATLVWKVSCPFETGILIEQSTNGTDFAVVDSAGAFIETKTVAGRYLTGTTYSFRIRAKSTYNYSGYSNVVTAVFTFSAPSNLIVTSLTETSANLQWTGNSTFETGFLIERSLDGTNFTLMDSASANITTKSIAGVYLVGTTYYFRVRAKSASNYSGYSNVATVFLPVRDISMISVPGGTFQMGSTTGYHDESPIHSVTVASFYIDKTELTYEKWTAVYNWGLTHGYTDLPAGQNGSNPAGANNPLTGVNWYDALKWCNARSEKEEWTPVYYTDNSLTTVYRTGQLDLAADAVKWTANGYRLPTEAEWEFAARGGTKSNGYTYSGSNNIDSVAWHNTNSGNTTHTVASKGANELGIYDMSGNVYERCWDWFGLYSASAETDPKGPSSGTMRVLRGSSFNWSPDYDCRNTFRDYFITLDGRYDTNGFRCVQD